jgi:2-amino-4-hydroxy-6-hydroxymethyldihydropteridine diphosphokinase
MKHIAYIGIGSNIGKSRHNCIEAIREISKNNFIKIISKSSFYQTSPISPIEQEWFINSAIKINTSLTPIKLLTNLLNIESSMGRVRKEKWGPRLIDLDLLFYDNQILNEENIIIPHPEVSKRNFVLTPLCEIAENLNHPILKKNIKTLLKESTDTAKVKKLKPTI